MRVAALLVLLACALLSSSVHAQSESDLGRAKASFKAGAAAYGAGDYPAAIQALESAYEITPLSAIAFSLAQAERRQYFATRERDHLERAITLFRRYVEQVAIGGRRADALDALSQLEPLAVREGLRLNTAERPLPPAEPPRTRLMISTEPALAEVSIDGSATEPSPVIREVAPERHHVLVQARGFFPAERAVMAVAGELVLAEIALRERPGVIGLRTPEDALIYVDGRFAHYGGADVRLELPRGAHRLTVAAKGRLTLQRTVVLERGQTAHIAVELPLTTQRKSARVLALAGGASLVGGIIVGGLAVREQRQAEDFLAQRRRANVSGAELADYHADASSRDRLRTAAIATVSAGLGVLLAALLLRELDRPDLRELEREPVRSAAPTARQRTKRVFARLLEHSALAL